MHNVIYHNAYFKPHHRRYPEVKDATDRALASLKMIRDAYIADIRKAADPNKAVKFPTSSDITAPYILACNHADGSPKMVSRLLSAEQLIGYERFG